MLRPLKSPDMYRTLTHPTILMIFCIAGAPSLGFMLYLEKAMEQRDSSKAIPGCVWQALNTLTEGLLLDHRERQRQGHAHHGQLLDESG